MLVTCAWGPPREANGLRQDASLKRCFGKDQRLADHDWEYVKTLRTKQAPHEPMPRLKDLLEYLAQPGREDVWVLLDIKVGANIFAIEVRPAYLSFRSMMIPT